MRLLTRNEAQKAKFAEHERQVQYGLKVSSLVDDKIKKLNSLNDELNTKKQIISNELEQFITEANIKKASLLSELSVLEERRRIALLPLDEYENRLKNKEKNLETKENDFILRERAIQESQKTIEEEKEKVKLEWGNVGDNLKDLDKKQVELAKNKLHLSILEKQVSQKVLESDKLLKEREDDYLKKCTNIEQEKALLAGEKIVLNEQKQELKKAQKLLESDRAALTAAFAEARKKNLL